MRRSILKILVPFLVILALSPIVALSEPVPVDSKEDVISVGANVLNAFPAPIPTLNIRAETAGSSSGEVRATLFWRLVGDGGSFIAVPMAQTSASTFEVSIDLVLPYEFYVSTNFNGNGDRAPDTGVYTSPAIGQNGTFSDPQETIQMAIGEAPASTPVGGAPGSALFSFLYSFFN